VFQPQAETAVVTQPGIVPGSAASEARGVLQTGLYGREANARAQAGQLKAAGFTTTITERTVNGARYWAVMVSPGTNMGQTIRALQAAGFESFPVY
jgi:cell division protein FtsN